MRNNDSVLLRPEAQPFEWKNLTDPEKKAFEQVVLYLCQAIADLPAADSSRDTTYDIRQRLLPRPLDHHRKSRVLFISGDRGTGKTSLLLSLQQAWAGGKFSEESKSIGDNISLLKQRGVWLETLDLEPLARPTNMLAAILVRIERAFERLIGSMDNKDMPGFPGSLLSKGAEAEDPIMDLQRLQTDVAIAWDGNLPARGEHLDPEPFALEVIHAERARLNVNERLSKILDQLASPRYLQRDITNPLFILTIDDFDLNPTRCLEILRLLRMISVPRLFTIILGNIEVAEKILQLNISAEITEVAGREVKPENLPVLPKDISSLAACVGVDSINKLVPYAQTIHLENMNHEKSLGFKFLENEKTLIGLLGEVSNVFQENGVKDFNNFFIPFEKIVKSPINEYTALMAFNAPIRRLADLWQSLLQLIPQLRYVENKRDRILNILDMMGEFTRQMFRRDRALGVSDRRRILEAIRQLAPGQWMLDLAQFTISPVYKNSRILSDSPSSPLPAMSVKIPMKWDIKISKYGVFSDNELDHKKGDDAGVFLSISEETTGWFVLFHDLLLIFQENNFSRIMVTEPLTIPDLVHSHWIRENYEIEIPWPMPKNLTFRKLDQLSSILFAITTRFQAREGRLQNHEQLEMLGYLWMIFVLSNRFGFDSGGLDIKSNEPDWNEPIEVIRNCLISESKRLSETDWKKIIQIIEHHLDSNSNNSNNLDNVYGFELLEDIFLILTPEIGLPDRISELFFESPTLENWLTKDKVVKSIRKRRRKLIRNREMRWLGVVFSYLEKAEEDLKSPIIKNVGSELLPDIQSEWDKLIDSIIGDLYTSIGEEIRKKLVELSDYEGVYLPKISGDQWKDLRNQLARIRDAMKYLTTDKDELHARRHPFNKFRNGILRPRQSDFERQAEERKSFL